MNIEQARINMVEQQVRTWDVLDPAVLKLLSEIPREDFVPDAFRQLAFADIEIPLADGQAMMPPRVEARMTQALQIQPHELVLEVGTGSGYVTALLGRLARRVISVEISRTLHEQAKARLTSMGYGHAQVEFGDASKGWPAGSDNALYDVIAVTGSTPVFTDVFQRQLKLGGRAFLIVGEAPAMEARLITRTGEHEWSYESLFETVVAPLEGAPEPQRFVF